MQSPSLLLDVLRRKTLLKDCDSDEMPVLSESLVSFASKWLPLEVFSSIPALLVVRSLPRMTLSLAWYSSTPLWVARTTTLSIRWFRWDSVISRPPLSSMRLRSTRLSLEGTPAGARCVMSITMPPLLDSSWLSTTVLRSEPSSATPPPLEPLISFASIRFSCARSTQIPGALVDWMRRVLHGLLPEAHAGLLDQLEGHVLDDGVRRAGVEGDAVVVVHDLAALDGDVVVAVVAHGGAEALAVDGVAGEVDGYPVRADDQAVEEAVGQVIADQGAAGQLLSAEDEGRHRRLGDPPLIARRAGVDVAGRVLGADPQLVQQRSQAGVLLRRRAVGPRRAVQRAVEGGRRVR